MPRTIKGESLSRTLDLTLSSTELVSRSPGWSLQLESCLHKGGKQGRWPTLRPLGPSGPSGAPPLFYTLRSSSPALQSLGYCRAHCGAGTARTPTSREESRCHTLADP